MKKEFGPQIKYYCHKVNTMLGCWNSYHLVASFLSHFCEREDVQRLEVYTEIFQKPQSSKKFQLWIPFREGQTVKDWLAQGF